MSGARIATIGEIVVDEVVHEAGARPRTQLGGGALYSALGALVWQARPEVHAVVGSDVPASDLDRIANRGVDLTHLTRIDRPGLGLWMLYERSGRRQQVPKLDVPSMLEIDLVRGLDDLSPAIDGVHVAPQTTEGQARALVQASGVAIRTLDAMVEPYIDLEPYRSGSILRGLTAFLPSDHEVEGIWGEIDPLDLARQLFEQAGLRWLVITRAGAGTDIVDRDGIRHIPALPRVVVDPTGAGDAFAGGYVVGLVETGDPVASAQYGTVSASFIVETGDAVAAANAIDYGEAVRRLTELKGLVTAPARIAPTTEVKR